MTQPDSAARGLPDGDKPQRIAELLRQQIGAKNYDHWFDGQSEFAVRDDRLTILVNGTFRLAWMKRNFQRAIAAAARTVLGEDARIRFEERPDGETAIQKRPLERPPETPRTDAKPAAPTNGHRYLRLTEFLAGPSNELALAAAHHVAQQAPEETEPLYLHGGVGLGKTHLLEGIAGRLRERHPTLQALLLTGESFTNSYTKALKEKSLPGFRRRMRAADVLLVDDVDFLEDKPGIQREFLSTLQHLESRRRQIVLAADRHPRQLQKTCEELTSRFAAGMVCRLQPPDRELRRRLVEAAVRRSKLDVAPGAIAYLVDAFSANVRELLGATKTLAAWQRMSGRRIELTSARRALADLERDRIRVIRAADVEQAVSEFFGVETKRLRSPDRSRAVSRPRNLAMYLIRKLTRAAYSEIGEHFNRKHTTVMAAEKKVRSWLKDGLELHVAGEPRPIGEILGEIEEQIRGW